MSTASIAIGASPNGGSVVGRRGLAHRFSPRISINEHYSRKVVSYQGNRNAPGLRWLKYKEGFSSRLVEELVDAAKPQAVLDPFAGICTTPLVAAGLGSKAMGIEIMPIGVLAGSAIAEVSNGLTRRAFDRTKTELLRRIRHGRGAVDEFAFPHVRITTGAFPLETEEEIARARSFIADVDDAGQRSLLDLACLSVLEESSYTRKDGQYLRWDRRADRPLRSSVDLGPVARFSDALENRLAEITDDIDALKAKYGGGQPELVTGSCLELLKDIPPGSVDLVITSPPYANRYDYTRTYALELAWMGYDQVGFQRYDSACCRPPSRTKENWEWLNSVYGSQRELLDSATRLYAGQEAIHEVLGILLDRVDELSNRHVLRLIEHYFFEMALVVAELGRIVRPGGIVVMVNDNVQYHGEELPVDFILSDFAEQVGFTCTNIWKLARGKGNSSQQMARFGRREIRKCVYRWVRNNG